MNPFFAGSLVALTMTLSVGPGLLLYFQACVRSGFVAGMAVLLGLWVSDTAIISITVLGCTQFLTKVNNQRWASVVCAVILFVFGLTQWIRKPAVTVPMNGIGTMEQQPKLFRGFISGFLINSSNPFVYVFWMTVVGIAGVNFCMRTQPFFIFFIGLFSCALTFDTTKCFIFSRVKVYFKPALIVIVNRIAGTALIVAAIVVVSKAFL